jgi:hypothetical protein
MKIGYRLKFFLPFVIIVSCAGLLCLSCTTYRPYRTDSGAAPSDCPSAPDGTVSQPSCLKASWETSSDYDLLFAEFDDQGLAHPKNESGAGSAYNQLAAIQDAFRTRFLTTELNLVVYVHGWKHNAAANDDDVKQFRKMLRSQSAIEKNLVPVTSGDAALGISHRRTVGVYIGWRGLSATAEPLKEISFWGRKSTSTRVAVGSARQLFAGLRAYQMMRNAVWDKNKLESDDPTPNGNRPPVQMIVLGHSFGAQLVFDALSENLIEALSSEITDPGARIQRYGDVVILINPAFEATQFLPLLQTAQRRKYDHYQAPLLVVITTDSDVATKTFFPAGRWFNSLFEHFSSADEREAFAHTVGHLDRYTTHTLSPYTAPSDDACKDWKAPENGTPEETLQNDIKLEQAAANEFFSRYRQDVGGHQKVVLPPNWNRLFCGGMQLQFSQPSAGFDPNIPIWVVRTDTPIIVGHNGFETSYFDAFVRQVHADTVDFYAIMTFPQNEQIVKNGDGRRQ